MRLNKILSLAAILTLLSVASAPASAQGSFSLGFSKFGKHSSFGVGFNSGFQSGGFHNGGFYPRHGGRIIVVDPVRHCEPVYETRCIEVWVPGCTEQVWVDPCYQTVTLPCGNVARVLVREGYFRVIQKPGHYETRHIQVRVR